MERSRLINSFVCSLFLLNFVQAKVFPPIETKCPPDCSAVSCLKPICKGGLFTPECECCPKCLSQDGEKCGVPEKTYGKCDRNLYCEKPDGSNQGLCAACPLFKCKPCDNGYELDARGCRTCKCKCPISSCLFIKCANGVIKTTDVNGCEQCKCKPPKCPEISNCALILCRYGVTKGLDKNGCEFCTCDPPKECPTSSCLFIKCANGVIKTTDVNGCEQCKCKPSPECPEISNCALIRCGYGVTKGLDKNGCEFCTCDPPKVCKDGETFFQDCNRCSCRNGLPLCTLIACQTGVCYYEGKAYENGQQRIASDGCNSCTCEVASKDQAGKWACTEKACVGCTHDGKSFNVGETRYEQCNQCTCNGNNIWACTKKGCPTGFCYFLGNQIPARTSFFDGCNRCTCIVKSKSEYGVLRCTRKACPGCPQIFCTKKCRFGFKTDANGCRQCQCRTGYCEFEGQKFTLRSKRYENCNKCVCTLAGWKCQEKTCPGGVCYKNGNTIADGVSFFDGCNTCNCLASDKSKPGVIACTKRACPAGCQPNLVCLQKCPNGYAKNRFGCSICKCAPKCVSNCPVLVCAGPSIERYFDDAGCEQCRCLPVGGLFCPLFPAPPPDTESVKCGLESFPCLPNECESDAECPYGKKCCVSGGVQGSPLKCITPVPFPIGK